MVRFEHPCPTSRPGQQTSLRTSLEDFLILPSTRTRNLRRPGSISSWLCLFELQVRTDFFLMSKFSSFLFLLVENHFLKSSIISRAKFQEIWESTSRFDILREICWKPGKIKNTNSTLVTLIFGQHYNVAKNNAL